MRLVALLVLAGCAGGSGPSAADAFAAANTQVTAAIELAQRQAAEAAKAAAQRDLEIERQNEEDLRRARVLDPPLRPESSELKQRAAEARAALEKAHKNQPKVSKECLDNPLAKGCN